MDPKLKQTQDKVNDVRITMQDNIKRSLATTENLQHMEITSQQLEEDSNNFRTGARKVRRLMCYRSWKITALIILGVAIVLIIIIVPSIMSSK
jgi:vesicle-associated membrane protein 4